MEALSLSRLHVYYMVIEKDFKNLLLLNLQWKWKDMWHEYANTWYKIIIISAILTGGEITDEKNFKPETKNRNNNMWTDISRDKQKELQAV